jgi:hypothetical protein
VTAQARVVAPAIVLAAGVTQCWRYRHFMYPDGIQYLDIARSVAAGDVSALLNTYWSPLYPLLLSGALSVLKPPAYWWYPVLQAVNAVIFVCAVWQFHALLSTVDRVRAPWFTSAKRPMFEEPFWTWTAYSLFLLLVTYLLNVRMMTPDMIVVCAWLAAARCLLHVQIDPHTPSWWIKTGVALAIGYLAKAVVFPTALMVIAIALVWAARRAAWRGPVVALVTFLALTAPYVVLLSQAWGGPTFGETGRLNYAWYVNQWQGGIYWRGVPPESGTPVHPPAQISTRPAAFAFAQSTLATYPLSYEPPYWTRGMNARVRLADQPRTAVRIVGEISGWGRYLLPAVLALGAAIVPARRAWMASVRDAGLAAVVMLCGVAIYLPVHIEARFVAAQLLVVLVLAAAALPRPKARALGHAVFAAIVGSAVVVCGPITAGAARGAMLDIVRGEARDPQPSWLDARALRERGLAPGDPVAVAGNTLDVAWAQLAELRIVADVPDSERPAWRDLTRPEREALAQAFARAGARWLVVREGGRTREVLALPPGR